MAEDTSNQVRLSLLGLGSLPIGRQIGVLIGVAAAIAIAGTVILWSKEANFRSLYAGLAEQDVMEVTDALQKAGIEFELSAAGTVLVPADKIYDARLKLASQGLPNSTSNGFDLLDKEQSFGTSQFMEKARYQRALEGELAMTISKLRNVESARVHLAIPKRTVFVRRQKQPSASVFVKLYSGRMLDEGQISAITHMVAASIPNLEPKQVALIDQKGRLLSSTEGSSDVAITTSQFSYRKKLEDYLTKRIENLLTPIVGIGGVRAQVTTELDFTVTEQTQEQFNPELPSVRSEQTMEEQVGGLSGIASGVPGALSNQPPEGGTVDEQNAAVDLEKKSVKSSRRSTRNYELDRTISHTRLAGGNLRRLSIAVVIDDRETIDENGEVTRTPLGDETMERLTSLIKEAVGYNQDRGDTVSIINTAFITILPPEPLPEIGILEQPWVWQVAKFVGGLLVALFVVARVLRVTRSLADKGVALPVASLPAYDAGHMAPDQLALTNGQVPQLTSANTSLDNDLNTAKGLVQQDAKRVAKVVRQWVGEDG